MAIKKKDLPYQPHGDIKRIVSLNSGKHAYLTDNLGKTHHLATDSDEFVELCKTLDEAFGGRIKKELEDLEWHQVLLKMA